MPRQPNPIPTYRLQATRNCGKVVVNGETVYFPGRHNSPESQAAYRRWLADFLATGRVRPADQEPECTVGELALRFDREIVWPRFRPDGKETGEARSYLIAMRALLSLHVDTPTSEFTPRDLKQVRQVMIDAGYTRKRINQHVGRLRRIFRWGVAEGLVPETTWRALTALDGLRFGEAKREAGKVKPVPEDRVMAVKPYVTPPIWAIIQLQLWTGARPSEILVMRTCDIKADDPDLPPDVRSLCWVYRPHRHKTVHKGKPRLILLGPQARAILEPWLRPTEPEAYLFSPAEARRWWHAKRRAKARQPRRKLTRKADPHRSPGDCYNVQAYRYAITRACEQAFGMPPELRRIRTKHPDGSPIPKEEVCRRRELASQWRKANCWHPHQLRHTAGTKLRAAYNVEVARIILGHEHIATTEIYAEADLITAAKAMAKMG